MKITEIELRADARKRLESAKADFKAAFTVRDAATNRAETVAAKRESLTDEIESAFQTLDPLDDAATARFAAKKTQAELLIGEARKSGAAIAGAEREIMMAARRGANTLRLVLQPDFNEQADEVISRFQPFYANRASAKAAVMQSDWGACFANQLRILMRVESVAEAENVRAWLDATLAGSIAWCFWRGAE